MKKQNKLISMALLLSLLVSGCSRTSNADAEQQEKDAAAGIAEAAEASETAAATTTPEAAETTEVVTGTKVNVASLTGPTSMGLVELMSESDAGETANDYDFEMYSTADEIVTQIVKGDADIALIPANLAANLYQKTEQGISVIDLNTLGVLQVVAHDDSITSIADLKGKTICMTGKGSVPEYVLDALLEANGLSADDVTIEFKSEPSEVIAYLETSDDYIGILPQPFVTSATLQDDSLTIALDLGEEWVEANDGSQYVTGVTIVRNDFLEENEIAVQQFMQDHAASISYVNNNIEEAADLIESYDIIKASIAKLAIPSCSLVCVTGDEMESYLSEFLQTLYDQNPDAVGGTMPDESFYYLGVTE